MKRLLIGALVALSFSVVAEEVKEKHLDWPTEWHTNQKLRAMGPKWQVHLEEQALYAHDRDQRAYAEFHRNEGFTLVVPPVLPYNKFVCHEADHVANIPVNGVGVEMKVTCKYYDRSDTVMLLRPVKQKDHDYIKSQFWGGGVVEVGEYGFTGDSFQNSWWTFYD